MRRSRLRTLPWLLLCLLIPAVLCAGDERWLLRQALALAPADPLFLRVFAPGRLGPRSVNLHHVLHATGAWALQPRSPESEEQVRRWLEFAASHEYELQPDVEIPYAAGPGPAERAALLWLAAARFHHLGGGVARASDCVERARRTRAALPPAWFDLAAAPPPFRATLEEAQAKSRAGLRDEALELTRSALAAASRARDGDDAVTAAAEEARRLFPQDVVVLNFSVALRWRFGPAMPKRSRWWALAASEALEKGQGAEALRRLRAARKLAEAMGPGGDDPVPMLWAAERWLARRLGDRAPALVARPGALISVPPGRWLANVEPIEAAAYALSHDWANECERMQDPRPLLRMWTGQDRPGEGLVVFAEELVRTGRYLEALQTLQSRPDLGSEALGSELALRVQALRALALEGEPAPRLGHWRGRPAERARAQADAAIVMWHEGRAGEARAAVDEWPPEAMEEPDLRRLAGLIRSEPAGEAPTTSVRVLLASGPPRLQRAWELMPMHPATVELSRKLGFRPAPGVHALSRRRIAMHLAGRDWTEAKRCTQELARLEGPGPSRVEPRKRRGEVWKDGLYLLNSGAYGMLISWLEQQMTAGPAAAPGAAAAEAADPFLGLKRDPESAWTTEGSPYWGSWSKSRRVAARAAFIAVLLTAWVRLHLFLMAAIMPGAGFFRWLGSRARRG